jgi:hypothetical protein
MPIQLIESGYDLHMLGVIADQFILCL